MARTTFKEFHFPDAYFAENVPWLEERLKKIEDETLKDATGLAGRVAAGIAGCLAVTASILAARDTLFDQLWGTHFPFIAFVVFEAVGIASAFHQFRLAYEPIGVKMAPDYFDGDGIARYLGEEPDLLEVAFLIETQKNINHNRQEIQKRNRHIGRGFFDLFLVTAVLLFHAVFSAILKFSG